MSEPKHTCLLDPASADLTIRPQDDFFRYVNGTWLRTHTIPSDRPVDGAFHALRDQSEERCKLLSEEAAAGTLHDPDADRIATLWSLFMDEATIENRGVAPLTPELHLIHDAASHDELAVAMGTLQRMGVGGLVGLWVGTNPHDSTATMLNLSQSGIGLPDEAYYREEAHEPIRQAYQVMVATLLTLAGPEVWSADPHSAAARVFAFEKAVAAHHRDAVADRDPLAHDNAFTLDQLEQQCPGFPWRAWLEAVGVDTTQVHTVNVAQPEHMTNAGKLWADTDLNVLKEWLITSVLDTRAPLLSSDFVNARFDFHGRVLSGTEELRPRWKRALGLIEGCVGEALGRLWVERYFPADSKERMDRLVDALLDAYRRSISSLDWMGEATRARALDKLATFMPKIGHPATWKDYSALDLAQVDDVVEAVRRASAVGTDRELAKLGKPVDRAEWYMTPQTVNAYYNPTFNEIVFPAAILQPPFFDPDADDAVNFGAIGAVIGHEIGHGFDDSGSRYDGDGNLKNWWDDADRERFEQRTRALIAQYDALTPADLAATDAGIDVPHVNGGLTVGENIGDLGGLTIAWSAFRAYSGLSDDEVFEPNEAGFSAAQRFFVSWATVWRTKARPEFARQMLAVDPHSPAEFRCNQVLANMDAFVQAFNVKPGDALWLDPDQRVRIW
ncbi:M13 family metallopeptidase [Schaalia suimastitidis]|uniref:M13 family metallopeptidase n=1 Tax=Schaalia suimastitidis TaxID=121163 RepID=UPI00040993A3|nr:M13-type metalloendopeptidase [Schaalia suimastitidis]